ncbi:hypothetical protein HELRODRAFT_128327, partial [Helobdella robusta]|uniref:C2H2-type domain-containing protein n=1 Tax=Helobdella robusta TaxID=6412 RepID=T1EHM7_HELRO
FKCDICSKVFRRKNGLEIHKNQHTGRKPCVCDVCGFSCNDPSNLNKHKKRH